MFVSGQLTAHKMQSIILHFKIQIAQMSLSFCFGIRNKFGYWNQGRQSSHQRIRIKSLSVCFSVELTWVQLTRQDFILKMNDTSSATQPPWWFQKCLDKSDREKYVYIKLHLSAGFGWCVAEWSENMQQFNSVHLKKEKMIEKTPSLTYVRRYYSAGVTCNAMYRQYFETRSIGADWSRTYLCKRGAK